MLPASLSTKDRLRRSKSARSFRKGRPPAVPPPPPEPFDWDLAKQHATTAASRAMTRSSERSSGESRSSYDRLGGPDSVAVPQRRRPSGSIQFTDDCLSVSHASVADGPPTRQPESPAGAHESYQSPTATLPPISEFGGLDGKNASQPSSYRRLRKAKSMFSTRTRPSHTSYGMSSPRDGSDAGVSGCPRQERTLRRSMSFLRGGQPSKAVRHAKSQDVSIQMARSQFLQNAELPGIPGRQPSLLAPNPRREHKPFRKTFRATSAPGVGAAGAPSWADQPRPSGSHGRARTISQTIKRGIKRVLGLSKPPGEPAPAQASPTFLSQYGHDSHPDHTPDGNDPRHSTGFEDDELSRSPTVLRKRSSDSIATSKSRVTSWADSTANTIALRRAIDENSLSIIDEHDDINRMRQQTPNSFRHEFMSRASPLGTRSSEGKQEKSVDSQRLYSALMKRIGRGNMQTPDDGASFGAVKEHRLVPERTSSAYSRRSRNNVRRIGSNESIISPRSYATAYCNMPTPTPTKQSQRRSRQVLPTIVSEQSQDQDGTSDVVVKDKDAGPHETEHVSDGSGSMIASQPGDWEYEPYSPSVYSRATSTPVQKDGVPGSAPYQEESGMVTILSSQRTAYSSPKRPAGFRSPGVPIQPSADWQKWMSTEVEKLERPRRVTGHARHNAEAFDDDDFRTRLPSIASGIYKKNRVSSGQPDTTARTSSGSSMVADKIPPQSNFSRPFSRSSSMRTIVPSREGPENTAPQPPPTSVFPTPDPAPDSDSPAFSIPNPFENKISLCPQSRSNIMPRAPESPTPKKGTGEAQQRRAANEQYRHRIARRSPVPLDGMAQTRPQRSRDQRMAANENIRLEDGRGEMTDPHKLQDIHSTISSKRMVDMFLDSRRRQMETETSDASGAFL